MQVDNRMRAWYQKDMTTGLLYICSLGDVQPDCPVALIENKSDGETDTMKVIPCEHQLPQQREQVGLMRRLVLLGDGNVLFLGP